MPLLLLPAVVVSHDTVAPLRGEGASDKGIEYISCIY